MEAGRAIEQGILNVLPDAEVTVKPLADGGEGAAGGAGRRHGWRSG